MLKRYIAIFLMCLCLIMTGCSAKDEIPESAAYTITFTDQHGAPVSGVMAQVCNDDTCMVYTSDTNGICAFELAPYAYEMHILKLPEGYSGDTETIVTLHENGGKITISLSKN